MRKLILALAIGAAAATAQAEPLLGGFVEGAWAVRTQQNPALDGAGSELGFIERAYPRDELRGQRKVGQAHRRAGQPVAAAAGRADRQARH